jgi:uncharacterized protein YqeY
MSLAQRIEADYKTAFKAQDRLRIDTLRLLKAAIQKLQIDKRKDVLDDAEVVQVLSQQTKQRQETIDAGIKNNRPEIADQAKQELAILAAYLPERLSADAIKALIEEAVKAVGANQGQIMKFVMAKAGGAVDGKHVSQLVAERLKPQAA